jgi:hypothetical protein
MTAQTIGTSFNGRAQMENGSKSGGIPAMFFSQ